MQLPVFFFLSPSYSKIHTHTHTHTHTRKRTCAHTSTNTHIHTHTHTHTHSHSLIHTSKQASARKHTHTHTHTHTERTSTASLSQQSEFGEVCTCCVVTPIRRYDVGIASSAKQASKLVSNGDCRVWRKHNVVTVRIQKAPQKASGDLKTESRAKDDLHFN